MEVSLQTFIVQRSYSLPNIYRKELSNILHLRRKAEIEILSSHKNPPSEPGFNDTSQAHESALIQYLTTKLNYVTKSDSTFR